MVRVQECQTGSDRLLIGSDLADTSLARRELEKWAQSHGYYLPRESRNLSVYEHGALVREWTLVLRAPQRKRGFFSFLARREASQTQDPPAENAAA